MTDPSIVETVVVKGDELVTALEANERGSRGATLRATAPYSARMRARLHVEQGDERADPNQVVIAPETVVDPSCPSPPSPDETEDELRADPEEVYTVERHQSRHREALAAWRERVPSHVRDRIEHPAAGSVAVTVLGRPASREDPVADEEN